MSTQVVNEKSLLVKYPSPALKNPAVPIDDPKEWASRNKGYIKQVAKCLKACNGAAIAGNQVGSNLAFWVQPNQLVMNPSYTPVGTTTLLDEGCLSIPGFDAEVPRYLEVNFKADMVSLEDLDKEDFEVTPFEGVVTGFSAQVVQHETDHLQGLLYIDRCGAAERSRIIGNYMKLKKAGRL